MCGPLVANQAPVGDLQAVSQAPVQMLPVKHLILHGGPIEILTNGWC